MSADDNARRVADAARLVIPFDAMGVWHAASPDDSLSLIAGQRHGLDT